MSRTRGIPISEIPPEVLARCGPDSPLRKVRSRPVPRALEHQEQCALFTWAKEHEVEIPELRLLFAIPNFAGRLGNMTAKHGAFLKAEGRKSGVPDICLPVQRGGCAGLFLELKAKGGTLTTEQRSWLAALAVQGYRAEVRIGWEAARDVLLEYLAS